MSDLNTHNLKAIFDYLKDKLSNKERYAIDREISRNPFLEDAMDGFSKYPVKEIEGDLNMLDERLQSRIKNKKSRKLVAYLKIAAGIAIIVGVGSIILYNSLTNINKKEIASNEAAPAASDTIKSIRVEEARKLLNSVENVAEEELVSQSVAKTEKKNKAATAMKMQKAVSKPFIEPTVTPENDVNRAELDSFEMLAEQTPDIQEEETNESPPMISMQIESDKIPAGSSNDKELTLTINGHIVDAQTGEPLPGAIVATDGNSETLSNISGNFDLKIVDDTLFKFSYLGYQSQEMTLSELSKNNFKVELNADQMALNEVVVVGQGTQRKKENTGAVSRIESSQITGIPQGKAAGVSTQAEKYKKPKPTEWLKISYTDTPDKHSRPQEGFKKLEKYISKNSQLRPEIPQQVVLEITIEASGNIIDIQAIKSPNTDFLNEAVRLVKAGPSWESAMVGATRVQEKVTLTITFQH